MTTPAYNPRSPSVRRILREAREFVDAPSSDYVAAPTEEDIFEWHFTIRGPPDSPYADGIYHGRISLPQQYPLRPPTFRFLTASGRFMVNKQICLSISNFHEESWQPAWGVRTALVALRSHMGESPRGQLGGLETPEEVRKTCAAESVNWKCSTCGKTNGEILKKTEEAAKEMEEKSGQATEVIVPEELKIGYQEDLEKTEEKNQESKSEATKPEEKTADGQIQEQDKPLQPQTDIPLPAVPVFKADPPTKQAQQSMEAAHKTTPTVTMGQNTATTNQLSVSDVPKLPPLAFRTDLPVSIQIPYYPHADPVKLNASNIVQYYRDQALVLCSNVVAHTKGLLHAAWKINPETLQRLEGQLQWSQSLSGYADMIERRMRDDAENFELVSEKFFQDINKYETQVQHGIANGSLRVIPGTPGLGEKSPVMLLARRVQVMMEEQARDARQDNVRDLVRRRLNEIPYPFLEFALFWLVILLVVVLSKMGLIPWFDD